MRVVYLVGKLNAGGVQSVIFNYLRNMDLDGIEPFVLYESDSVLPPPDDLVAMGIKFIEIPPYQSLFSYIGTIKKLCREYKFDIVHSNMNTLSVFSLYAAWRGKVRVRICHNHSTTSKKETKRNLFKIFLRPFNRLFATDYAACSELAARWMYGDRRFEKGKVKVFNNAVDCERFSFDETARKEVRDALGIGDALLIGHVGRFTSVKNHPFLIDIFESILKIRPDSHLVLVGDGEDSDAVRSKVETAGISDKVTFSGIVSDTERYYSAMDVFLLPSLYEGLPVVAVEAESSGLSCFISDTVTRECAATPHVTFLPITEGAEMWARAVASANPHDRAADSENMKNGKFNIVKCADEMMAYYLEISGRKK